MLQDIKNILDARAAASDSNSIDYNVDYNFPLELVTRIVNEIETARARLLLAMNERMASLDIMEEKLASFREIKQEIKDASV